MIQRWITHEHNERLIIIFLGWGADASAIEDISRPGYDILALWSYIDESIILPTESYSEVCVIAWSFGVMEASRILGDKSPSNVTLLLAVNGTECPVDDTLGIPVKICEGTLANLDERNLRKFYRRMFTCKEDWDAYSVNIPQRSIDELTNELSILCERAQHPIPHLPWTAAYFGEHDAIFPPQNQVNYWTKMLTPCIEIKSGHFPDWQDLIDQSIVDKEYVAHRFDATAESYDNEADLQRQIASHLWKYTRQQLQSSNPINVLEIGCGSGILTRQYLAEIKPSEVTLWDISPGHIDLYKESCNNNLNICFKRCDAEIELQNVTSESLDLIISSSTIQWFHSPGGFLRNAARALRSGGILAFSTYGPQMCRELKLAGIITHQYFDADTPMWRTAAPELQLITCESALLTKQFASPHDVFRHLRRSGVNALRRTPIATATMRNAINSYPLDANGYATLTFHPLYFIYRKK